MERECHCAGGGVHEGECGAGGCGAGGVRRRRKCGAVRRGRKLTINFALLLSASARALLNPTTGCQHPSLYLRIVRPNLRMLQRDRRRASISCSTAVNQVGLKLADHLLVRRRGRSFRRVRRARRCSLNAFAASELAGGSQLVPARAREQRCRDLVTKVREWRSRSRERLAD